MIKTVKNKALRKYIFDGDKSKINPKHLTRINQVVSVLHSAKSINSIALPGMNLHSLKGELENYWSVSITGNYRLTFKFENGDIFELDYIDYH